MNTELPKRYRSKSLKDYNNIPDGVIKAVENDESVLIYGPCGTGKTHLAIGLAKKWATFNTVEFEGKKVIRKGEVQFMPAVEFFLELKQTFNGEGSEEEIIKHYASSGLLVIDDLGSEKISDWSRQMLYVLIDRRYRNCRQTIITTNLTPKNISEKIDDRIMSRISEMGRIVKLDGEDKRLG